MNDIEVLYPRWSERVRSVVAGNVTAPEDVIEEACQVAWVRLHGHRERVAEGAALGWLCTTATREALRIVRRRSKVADAPLEVEGVVIELPARAPGPEQVAELREQLGEVRRLPVRQRQVLWLQALGYDYGEIAACTGDSRRTVERQLERARRNLAGRALELRTG